MLASVPPVSPLPQASAGTKVQLPPPPFSPHPVPLSSYWARHRLLPPTRARRQASFPGPGTRTGYIMPKAKPKREPLVQKPSEFQDGSSRTLSRLRKWGLAALHGSHPWCQSSPEPTLSPKQTPPLPGKLAKSGRVEPQGPKGTGLGKRTNAALAQKPHPLPQVLRTPHSHPPPAPLTTVGN